MKKILIIMSMNVVCGEGTGVSLDAESFATGRMALSDEARESLSRQADALLASLAADAAE